MREEIEKRAAILESDGGSHQDAIRMEYRAFERLTHPIVADGETYYFCSQACTMEFDDNPHAYV